MLHTVTGHNGHKPKRPQPKRPQTETATNRNGHKPERPQTETATNRNGHKPERPQTRTATNRNGHRPERPQTETATSVVTHHISCHQNKYDGESPIGNDDIHACDDVTVPSRAHIADDSIEDSRMSNGWNYGQCNKITAYGEQYIYELQLIYAGDPIWIKGKEERNKDGAHGGVKPYDQSCLFILIYDTPQIEYSCELHMNYSNKTRRWLTI